MRASRPAGDKLSSRLDKYDRLRPMTSLPGLAPRRPSSTVTRALLLAVAVMLAVLHASQPLHFHRGTTAGLYNEEHVLAALDSVSDDAPLPESPSAIPADLVTGPNTLAAGARLSAPVARHADSRAPPPA